MVMVVVVVSVILMYNNTDSIGLLCHFLTYFPLSLSVSLSHTHTRSIYLSRWKAQAPKMTAVYDWLPLCPTMSLSTINYTPT